MLQALYFLLLYYIKLVKSNYIEFTMSRDLLKNIQNPPFDIEYNTKLISEKDPFIFLSAIKGLGGGIILALKREVPKKKLSSFALYPIDLPKCRFVCLRKSKKTLTRVSLGKISKIIKLDKEITFKICNILKKHKQIHILSDDIYEHITYENFKFFTIATIAVYF